MKIKQVESRINASYNTIKKFIESKSEYNETIDNVLHVTKIGILELEKKYGVKTEVLSDDNIQFYKNQIVFLKQQLDESRKYNDAFIKQIEIRDSESEHNKKKIIELEKINQVSQIEIIELKHKIELEQNKSVWKKIFGKKKV